MSRIRNTRIKLKNYITIFDLEAFIICLFATTSTLISYIVPSNVLRFALVLICFMLELYCLLNTKLSNLKIIFMIFLLLVPVFVFRKGSWGLLNNLYYVSVLIAVALIMAGKWPVKFTLKFMYFMYLFYATCTILFYFTPSFYKGVIVDLFPENKVALLENYNSGCMPGLTGHYSTNGMFLSTGFLMACTYLIVSKKKKRNKLFQMLFLLIALLLTGKRAHLIFSIFSVYIVYYLASVIKGKNVFSTFIKVIGVILVIGVIGIIVISVLPALSIVIVRLQESIAEGDLTNGRYKLWRTAIRVFEQHPIKGIGWKNFAGMYGNGLITSNKAYDVHNVFLQLLCETGIIGFSIYMYWFTGLAIKALRQMRNVLNDKSASSDDFYFICFALMYQIFFLLYCMTGNPLYEKTTYVPYFICCGITLYYESLYGKNTRSSKSGKEIGQVCIEKKS